MTAFACCNDPAECPESASGSKANSAKHVATASVVTRVANAAIAVAMRTAAAETTRDSPISTWNANTRKFRAYTGLVNGTLRVVAAVRSTPTTAARNQTDPDTAAHRAARCWIRDICFGSLRWAGSANAATMSSPTVSAAMPSCTARAMGRLTATKFPASTSDRSPVSAPVNAIDPTAQATASGTAMARTVATVDARAGAGSVSGAGPPGSAPSVSEPALREGSTRSSAAVGAPSVGEEVTVMPGLDGLFSSADAQRGREGRGARTVNRTSASRHAR